MNRLVVGQNKSLLLEDLPSKFLLIDDEIGIDIPRRRKVVRFDVTKHSFNPLKEIDYRRAREFVSVINAIFPEGENTLTRKSANFVLLNALTDSPKRLSSLLPRPRKDDVGLTDAHQKIQTLLLSPVLERVLNRPTNFSFDGIILARLNRAELTDFDCYVIANLLISNYEHTVILPDFGFYGAKHHVGLIRQNRLWAGVNFLDETPLKNQLLLIEDKIPRQTTAEDAETLASYVGLTRNTVGYNDFIEDCVRG